MPLKSASRPVRAIRLVCIAGLAAILMALAGRWAYDNIAGVHYRVLLAWARVYDRVEPHTDSLPTPMAEPSLVAPTVAPDSPAPSPMPTPTAAVISVAAPIATTRLEPSAVPPGPTATAIPGPTATAIPGAVLLTGVRHEQQYFNNCGPTTLAMDLSYWGWKGDQHVVAAALRPNQDDKNVSPSEMPGYLQSQGFDSVIRVNGDVDTLRRFVAAGYPVIIQKGLTCNEGDDHCSGWVGHYALIVGYYDSLKEFVLEDSFRGSGIRSYYHDLLADWRAFNYVYIVPYPAGEARRAQVLSLLGDAADPQRNVRDALARAQAEAASSKFSPAAFAWFNVGTNLTTLGDYRGAAAAYDQARQLRLPFDMLWYQFGPFKAYYQVGRYEDLDHLASFAIDAAHLTGVEEAYYWRGQARAALNLADKAVADYRAALDANPNFQLAQQALTPPTETP